MPTPNERKGLLFLALVALSGTGVRVWRARLPPPTQSEVVALDRQLGRVDSARQAKRGKARAPRTKAKVPAPAPSDSQPIDINAASASQIEGLPGIGPALAKRIVAHRDSAGFFADFAGLCDVRGVGPALAERLRPLVTFGGRISPLSDACDSPSTEAGKARAGRGRKRP
jgi:competence ComEA-like helix-hairpin-helix protein